MQKKEREPAYHRWNHLDEDAEREGGIRFAARWKEQERRMMLNVLENLPGEGKGRLSKGSGNGFEVNLARMWRKK